MRTKCLETNCHTIAGYNMPGESIAAHCSKHRSEDMVHVQTPHNAERAEQIRRTHPACEYENCNIMRHKDGNFCTHHR